MLLFKLEKSLLFSYFHFLWTLVATYKHLYNYLKISYHQYSYCISLYNCLPETRIGLFLFKKIKKD